MSWATEDDGDAGCAISIILAISDSDAPSRVFSRIFVTMESTCPDTRLTLIQQRVPKRHIYRIFIDGSPTALNLPSRALFAKSQVVSALGGGMLVPACMAAATVTAPIQPECSAARPAAPRAR